jgi:hypothetical protein
MAATCTVGCKMPNGLILRVFDQHKEQEAVLAGTVRDVTRHRAREARVVLNGTRAPEGTQPPLLVGGYAMTHGCDEEIVDLWFEQNKGSDLVKNLIVLKHKDAKGIAAAHEKVRTGLEPLDPKNLPVKGIETADVKGKAA